MTRLIWQFREPGRAPGVGFATTATSGAARVLQTLEAQVGFTVHPAPVADSPPGIEPLALPGISARPDLYHALPASPEEGERGLAILREFSDEIEEAVLELEVGPPELSSDAAPSPCEPVTLDSGDSRPWDRCQGYLDPAPMGIDARHAWSLAGGRGQDVTLVDVELGYNPRHEELRHVGSESDPVPYHAHGTMSLGVCCADGRNGVGVRGIAHEATARFEAVEGDWIHGVKCRLVSRALWRWVERLEPGSVILLEVAARYYHDGPYNGSWFPVDVSTDVKRAVADAARNGIYVVEVAGNGNVDLDAAGVRTRTEAILVGGGTVPGRRRWRRGSLGSNHGSRVDLHGWAEKVVTTGAPGGIGDNLQAHTGPDGRNRCYTRSFNGTSSAAAMVAGAVASLSGILSANGVDPLSPREMRNLLMQNATLQGPGDHIGPLPDLRKAIAELQERFGPLRAASDAAA